MVVKQAYGKSAVWRPDTDGTTQKLLAGSCELGALKLSASAGSAAVEIYDSADAAGAISANMVWFLDASTTDNDMSVFTTPLAFEKGVFAKLVTGAGFAPYICIERVGKR